MAGLLSGLLVCIAPEGAQADVRVELLAIGNNQALGSAKMEGEEPGAGLPVLRYADDDAAAFYRLLSEGAEEAHLLTVLDAESQARFPGFAALSHPPTIAELQAAVAGIERRIEINRRHGDKTVVYVFFSGHGAIRDGLGPALALLDGDISHDFLYDEILDRLPADVLHLFVDACHAEGVVRPRDGEGRTVSVNSQDAGALLMQSTLRRFPRVGAIVATSSDAQAHEWDQLGHGIFTNELLSALRGAADVNRDHRVEYSEVFAYLSAANRGVLDVRARLSVVARPPQIDQHAAIVDLSGSPPGPTARLTGVLAGNRRVEVEDGSGQPLATVHGETGFVVDLTLPAGTNYLRIEGQEAKFDSRKGQVVPFEKLEFRRPRQRPRGALEDAVRTGLFASEFGRGYYTGFIDRSPDFTPVSFDEQRVGVESAIQVPMTATLAERERTVTAVAGLGVARPVSRTFEAGADLRLGLRSARSRGPLVFLDVARASDPGISEWQAVAQVGWRWTARYGVVRGWVSGAGGLGIVMQSASGTATRWSPLLAAGPALGGEVQVTSDLALWVEGEGAAAVYRKQSDVTLGFRPTLLAGVAFDL